MIEHFYYYVYCFTGNIIYVYCSIFSENVGKSKYGSCNGSDFNIFVRVEYCICQRYSIFLLLIRYNRVIFNPSDLIFGDNDN